MAIKFLGERPSPWRVYWRNPFTKKIETKHFTDKDDAEKHDSLVKHWIKHDPEQLRPELEEEPAQVEVLTVWAVIESYLADIALKPKSMRDTLYHLKSVTPIIGSVPVPDLTEEHMLALVKSLKDRGLKANGINRKVGIVTAALNWAKVKKIIPVNPVYDFKAPRGKDAQIPPPSETETELILANAAPHIVRVIILGWHFGMRVGESELFTLKWSQIDLKRGTILVWSADKNKDMQWRELRIPPALVPVLLVWKDADLKAGAMHVIHYRDKPVTTIKRAWRRALERAGITRRIRPYDLRHAHATQALAHGADIKAVSQNMGHADTSMIHRHYQHVLVKQRDEAIAVVPNLVIQSGNTNGRFQAQKSITGEKKT